MSEILGSPETSQQPFVVVLGTAQDGGFPQAGCTNACCDWARADLSRRRLPACLGVVDPVSQQRWMLDCTPNFPEQLEVLNQVSDPSWGLAGVFLTHGHIGHYVGLIHLGKEVMGARGIPLYVMPRMRSFIESDSPWRQLVEQDHVRVHPLSHGGEVVLNERIRITPFEVPHRDEISETVGFRVSGPGRSIIHLPDIDSWDAWQGDVSTLLSGVAVAWLDGTFYDDSELPHRNLAAISHPFMVDSLAHFQGLPKDLRSRIRFTHLNHSNPAANPESEQAGQVRSSGHHIAVEGEMYGI